MYCVKSSNYSDISKIRQTINLSYKSFPKYHLFSFFFRICIIIFFNWYKNESLMKLAFNLKSMLCSEIGFVI